MHYEAAGQGRPALAFVHGFTCDQTDWRFQFPHFSRTHQVVACDLRGHGATPGRADECTIENYGGDVAALLASLEIGRAVLVGHSMGCRVVLEAARLDPERVAGLVLIDGSRAPGVPGTTTAPSQYAAFVEPLFREMFLQPSPEAEAATARALRLPADIGTALWARLIRWDVERMGPALETLRAPVMAIQSTYLNAERKRVPMRKGDTMPWLEFLREKRPEARIEVLPGVGHFAQFEAPDAVNRLIESFLKGLD